MNKITTLVFCLSLSLGSVFSQKIDYDNSSNWFLGLNAGATWQTTDVANKFSAGWGLTLGRSFNYNYGKKISFDLRARYLRGTWLGQDYDTTSLAGYTGTSLLNYKDSLGFSVNNFQADVHRLGFELVLHANGFRERTGWDPYIFGGIGFTWHQTFGDLYNNDSIGSIYGYDPTLLGNKAYMNNLKDNVYDSPLDGSNKDKYNVSFMPSVGFGIGYQVGKRVTLGLEHKTTFTLIDNFDGFVDPTSKFKDIYHYTSAYLQFRFKTHNQTTTTTDVNTVNNINNYNNAGSGCVSPTIKFINPASNGLVSASMNYQVVLEIKDILGRDNIVFKQNGITNLNYTYNAETDRLESTVVLVSGINTFEITATNTCGSDVETITVNYQPCNVPEITKVNPSTNGTTVSNANYSLSLLIQHSNNGQGITLTHNDRSITNYTFNTATGSFQSSLTLLPGLNTFLLTSVNSCGTDTETITVNYQNCIAPVITVVTPTSNGTTVSSANFSLSALILNSNNGQGITLKQNNMNVTNFSFNNATSAFQSTVTLVPGLNTFVLTTVNSCGTDTETITVNYQNCIAPVITVVAPTSNGTTVSSASFSLSALILNSSNGQGITLKQNNMNVTNFSFNNATSAFQSTVTLVPGINKFVLTTVNSCGTDTETITVNYDNCVPPVITVTNPTANGTTVTSSVLNLGALIQNANNGQGITLNINGRAISNFNFANATGVFQSTLNLTPGLNTIVLTSVNSCGTDVETITVNYQNCIAPVITVVAPTSNGTIVSSASFSLSALILNSNNGQGITLKQNNVAVANFSFNNATSAFQSTVTLVPGLNTFVLTTINSCGTDTETITVNYQNCIAPVITVVAPTSNGTTVTSSVLNLGALIQNANNGQGITLNINGRAISNFNFANATGVFQSTLNLTPGLNTIVLTSVNSCGTDVETITVNYQNCIAPVITVVAPTSNGTTVTSASFSLSALILNSNNGQGITLKQNNVAVTNFSFNNATSAFQSAVTLVPGLNTFVLTTVNSCGTDTETITVNYQNCIAPVITVVAPTSNGTTVSSASFSLSALILNSNNGQGITLNINGRSISNFTFSNATGVFQSTLNLTPGINTLILTSVNSCGTDVETITVNYQNCIAPVITVVAPTSNGTTVSSASFSLSALILNSNNGQGITLNINGRSISNFTFSNATGVFQSTLNLTPGLNTIVLTSVNSCGTDTETITINYDNCVPPVITITNPTVNGTTVTSSVLNLGAVIQNANNGQGITLNINGRTISNFNFANATGVFQSTLNLTPGLNTIVLTSVNSCGTDTETITINYDNCVPPVISITNTAVNGTTVTSPTYGFSALIEHTNNGQGITLTQNNTAITGFNFNNNLSTMQASITLIPGLNTFVLSATNSCGNDSKTATIFYKTTKPGEVKPIDEKNKPEVIPPTPPKIQEGKGG